MRNAHHVPIPVKIELRPEAFDSRGIFILIKAGSLALRRLERIRNPRSCRQAATHLPRSEEGLQFRRWS